MLGLSLATTSLSSLGFTRQAFTQDFRLGMPSGSTYTRAGGATGLTSAGLIQSFAANEPQRTDRGLALEPARTNLALHSADLTNAAWAKTACTVSTTTLAPDQGSASRLTASGLYAAVMQSTVPVVAGEIYTLLVYGRFVNQEVVTLNLLASGGSPAVLSYAFSTKTLSGGNATFTSVSRTVVEGAGGWVRLALTVTIPAGMTTMQPRLWLGHYSQDNVAGTAVDFWNADLVLGNASTSPIITTGTSATRGLPAGTVQVPYGYTKAILTYADGTTTQVTGLTAGSTFDYVTHVISNDKGRFGVSELVTIEWHTPLSFFLSEFMAAQSDGFWLDFTKTDRQFQEVNGPTPADDPNEVIGLSLSQRTWNGQTLAQVVAAAPELVANPGPSFPNTTGWTPFNGGILSIVGGELTLTGNGSTGFAGAFASVTGLVVGQSYRLAVTARRGTTASNVQVRMNSNPGLFVLNSSSATDASGEVFFVATATSDSVVLIVGGNPATGSVVLKSVSFKEVSRYPASQATAAAKPKYQTTGAAFDGVDDNLLTGYTAGAGANFIVARVTIPVSLAETQIIAGTLSQPPTQACFVGVNASGILVGGVGLQSFTTIVGSGDLRGAAVVIGISFDGSTVKLFANGAEVYSAAQSGLPSGAVPFRVGARNLDGGTATNFFGGSIKSIVAGREFLTLERFNQIASQL